MKRFLIGFLSVLILLASVMGASSRRPKAGRSGGAGDRAMWV